MKAEHDDIDVIRKALEHRARIAEWLLGEGQGEAAIAALRRSLPCHCPECMFRALVALAGVVAQHIPRANVPALVHETNGVLALYASVRRDPRNDRFFGACCRPDDLPSVEIFQHAPPLAAQTDA
ncbi:hypothetical protein [Acidiphilium angustum]|uniref:hypothetical protein n=1 Tax=Acidiphilium angustum TaxID=523 RepID=UPI0004945728|nr:hypothetical protein [Acidiphilium angustum]